MRGTAWAGLSSSWEIAAASAKRLGCSIASRDEEQWTAISESMLEQVVDVTEILVERPAIVSGAMGLLCLIPGSVLPRTRPELLA